MVECSACHNDTEHPKTFCEVCSDHYLRLRSAEIPKKIICPYGLVTPSNRTNISRLLKAFAREANSERRIGWTEFTDRIRSYISTLADDDEFHQKSVTSSCSSVVVNGGERTRENLDYLCCKGEIQKTRFKLGKGGHLYTKRAIVSGPCPRFDPATGCTYSFNLESENEPPIILAGGQVVVEPVREWSARRQIIGAESREDAQEA
ncbi:MAG: hypothetical protein WC792_04505 [Candidatus Micrarchaeia archaeon]|jgi:hypothetical protein